MHWIILMVGYALLVLVGGAMAWSLLAMVMNFLGMGIKRVGCGVLFIVLALGLLACMGMVGGDRRLDEVAGGFPKLVMYASCLAGVASLVYVALEISEHWEE